MNVIIPYKRDFVTLNKSVINYLPRCSYHLLYSLSRSQAPSLGITLSNNNAMKSRFIAYLSLSPFLFSFFHSFLSLFLFLAVSLFYFSPFVFLYLSISFFPVSLIFFSHSLFLSLLSRLSLLTFLQSHDFVSFIIKIVTKMHISCILHTTTTCLNKWGQILKSPLHEWCIWQI